MGRATYDDWHRDINEAVGVAAMTGDRVIIIGCSTGCTLATIALAEGKKAHAMVHVSPNFGLSHAVAQWVLDLPRSEDWTQILVGQERSFNVLNEAHAAHWTLRYPTRAVHTMAETVRKALAAPIEGITTPALFCYNRGDKVVSARRTRKAMARWGAAVEDYQFHQTKDDDPMGHIMAGDVFSPGQTEAAVRRILSWLNSL